MAALQIRSLFARLDGKKLKKKKKKKSENNKQEKKRKNKSRIRKDRKEQRLRFFLKQTFLQFLKLWPLGELNIDDDGLGITMCGSSNDKVKNKMPN